jgi:hypothetical protein
MDGCWRVHGVIKDFGPLFFGKIIRIFSTPRHRITEFYQQTTCGISITPKVLQSTHTYQKPHKQQYLQIQHQHQQLQLRCQHLINLTTQPPSTQQAMGDAKLSPNS